MKSKTKKERDTVKRIDINVVKLLAKVSVSGLIVGLSFAALVGVNEFFNQYYLDFQSPIVIQSPILVNERESIIVDSIVKEVEAVEVPEKQTETIVEAFSENTQKCVTNNPEVAAKLKDAFGEEYATVAELVCRESSFNSEAVNKSSGACGLFQAYPCAKQNCSLGDVNCQIDWGKEYITNRYGSAEAALLFHDQKGWY